MKFGQVFVAGGIVADDEAFHMGITGDLRCLACGGMEGFFGTGEIAFGKSRFMIEQVRPFDNRDDRAVLGRIGPERITLGRSSRTRQAGIGNDLAFGRDIVLPLLDIFHATDGNLIEIRHLADDMRLLRFLGKEIAAGGNPVLQRDGVDRQRTVFHHQRMAAGIDRIETHFELHAPAEQIHHGTQVSLDLLRTVHDQLAGASQHAERGDQSRQTEAVVAMQMRDEDMGETAETDAHPPHLHLGTFPTINHIQFVS